MRFLSKTVIIYCGHSCSRYPGAQEKRKGASQYGCERGRDVIRLLVLDPKNNSMGQLTGALMRSSHEVFIVSSSDYLEYEPIPSFTADAVLIDADELPLHDTLKIITALCESGYFHYVYVLTSLLSFPVSEREKWGGKLFFYLKPIGARELVREFDKASEKLFPLTGKALISRRTSSILSKLGYSPHYSGYSCVKMAVEMLAQDLEGDITLSKTVYPSISRRTGLKPGNVERSIRSCNNRVWSSFGEELRCRLAGEASCAVGSVPSNKQMLSAIAYAVANFTDEELEGLFSGNDGGIL